MKILQKKQSDARKRASFWLLTSPPVSEHWDGSVHKNVSSSPILHQHSPESVSQICSIRCQILYFDASYLFKLLKQILSEILLDV